MKGLLGNKKILMILIAVVVGGVGAFGALTVMSGGKSDAAAPAAKAKPEEQGPGPLYRMKDRVVNLSDQGGRRFLKVGMAVEVKAETADFYKLKGEARSHAEEEISKELAPFEPLMNDAITSVLTTKTFEEVASAAGKDKLKKELKEKLDPLFEKNHQHIVSIYFTEFIVQ